MDRLAKIFEVSLAPNQAFSPPYWLREGDPDFVLCYHEFCILAITGIMNTAVYISDRYALVCRGTARTIEFNTKPIDISCIPIMSGRMQKEKTFVS